MDCRIKSGNDEDREPCMTEASPVFLNIDSRGAARF
jgi:hypothetical protein